MSDTQMTTSRGPVVRADAAARARQAAELRVGGLTWEQIGDRLGMDRGNVQRLVREHFEAMPTPDIDELRREMFERCQWLWSEAARDVVDRRPGAVTAATKVMDRMARLVGADAPSRAEVEHHSVASIFALVYPVAEMPVVGAPIELAVP